MSFPALRILSAVVGMVAASLILPMAVAARDGEWRSFLAFAAPMAASWLAVLALWLSKRSRSEKAEMTVRHAFVLVGGAWTAIGVFGAIPLWLSGVFPSFTDALFESVSGFTTTGASVLGDVENLPRSVNLWRCMTHWLGGMGVVVLVVALVPILGVGGFRLIKAETTGPEKSKITARVAETAKALWSIYLALTMAETLLLRLAGMEWFDSLCHAFSTLGTGGFSTRNDSIGAFSNAWVEIVITVFMVLASLNFALYYRALSGRLREIARDSELRVFATIFVSALLVATVANACNMPLAASLRYSAFQVASIMSTTGFGTSDYTEWHPVAKSVILCLFFIGGCSGSTAGGIKVVRWTVLAKQLACDLRRLLHPHEVFTLRLNGEPGREKLVPLAASFIFAYLSLAIVTAFFGAMAGLDITTAFSGAISMIGNVGPAFGDLGPSANYGSIPAALKWWYCFAMLAGRLELYTMFILVGVAIRRMTARSSK